MRRKKNLKKRASRSQKMEMMNQLSQKSLPNLR